MNLPLVQLVDIPQRGDARGALSVAELGWAPQEDFQSGFRKTVRWYLDNPAWIQGILDGSYRLERLGKL